METAKNVEWHIEDIREQIDLDEIINTPSRVTVYQLKETRADPKRIVININYLSPIPITRSIEFIVLEGKAFLEADNMIMYPMPPSMVSSFLSS